MNSQERASGTTWRHAQERELEWWSEHRGSLSEADFIEAKRLATRRIWENIEELLDGGRARVLEIGTGGDGFVNWIPDAYCVGLEPLLVEMKQRGIGIFSPSARFLRGVGEWLPFRDSTFDVVFSYNVLDHTSDFERGLDEMTRVLRSGGVLHLLLDTYSLTFRLYRRFYRPDPMHPHTFTARQILQALSARGFRIARDMSDPEPTGRRRHRSVRVFCVLEKQSAPRT